MRKVILKLYRIIINPIRLISWWKFEEKYHKWMSMVGMQVDQGVGFIHPNVDFDGTDYSMISIEGGVIISTGVRILVHDYSPCSAYRVIKGNGNYAGLKEAVKIKKGAFIGANSILLPGCVVGKNTIIGAGSVVKGIIPDNVVAAGNPCKVICSLKEYVSKCENRGIR